MMNTLRPRSGETTDATRCRPASVAEDYEGLAWYLARAIAHGDANFDKASAELHASATSSALPSRRADKKALARWSRGCLGKATSGTNASEAS
jgi:hypothetical protein